MGRKYGYSHIDEEGNALAEEFGPSYLLNLSFTYDHSLKRGFCISLSAFDLLNQKPSFIQPYNGGFYPYPGRSREVLVKISLSTAMFKKK
jgi:hypothetical protein